MGEDGLKEDNSVDNHHHHQLPSVDNHHHQLPSILETDPAVAQAVSSAEPFYPQPMLPQGPNLLQTLFGLPSPFPTDPQQHLGGHHPHHGRSIPTHGPLPGAFRASADPFA